MRKLIILSLILGITCNGLSAANAGTQQKLTDAEKAKIKAQVESLQAEKLKAADRGAQSVADLAKRQAKAVEEKQQQGQELIDRKTQEWSYVVGPEAAQHAGAVKSQQLSEAAKAEKQKIKAAAEKKAAEEKAAAQKRAANVGQSIEGLKSQVAKPGQYGLQPKGSNLYVRQYGK